MFLADTAATTATGFDPFNWFILAFTLILAIGFYRLVTTKDKKNLFAIGFCGVALAVFLLMDVAMLFIV